MPTPKFHFNKRAAYAFATRFYLHKGDWDQVVAYADYVLGGDAKKNLRRWNRYADALEFDHPRLHRLYNATDEPANLLLTTTRIATGAHRPPPRNSAPHGTLSTRCLPRRASKAAATTKR